MSQSNEAEGFKFAVTLLVAIVTILYAIYNHLQNAPVEPQWYVLVCGFYSIGLILILGLIVYILTKGYSLEVKDTDHKKFLEKWASRFYLSIFLVSIMLLVFVLGMVLVSFLNLKNPIALIFMLFFAFVSVLVGIAFLLPVLRKHHKKEIYISLIAITFFYFIIIWASLVQPIIFSPLQGHITVDMESIYYKNEAPIAVLIRVTGQNTDLVTLLFEEESNNFTLIDSIILNTGPHLSKVSGEFLVGDALDYGTYNVFINTTNLSEGYYELECLRWQFEKTNRRGFYLLNSSK